MKRSGLILLSIAIVLLVGCGGGGENDSLPVIYTVEDVNISASSSNKLIGTLTDSEGKSEGFEFILVDKPIHGTIVLSADGEYEYTPDEGTSSGDQFTYSVQDTEGRSNIATVNIVITIVSACLSTRETLLSKEFLINENQSAVITTLGDKQEIAGFVVELDAYSASDNARTMLGSIISRIDSEVSTVNTISEQKTLSTIDSITGQYRVIFSSFGGEISSVDLNNRLYRAITNDEDAELPEVIGDALMSANFRLWLTVIYNDQNSVMVILALVPEANYDDYAAILDAYADGGNIALCGSEISSSKDEFIAEEVGSNLADFLFVVDNSGSMGNEQVAVQEAANVFANTIEGVGLDYRIGVITTDNDNLRGTGFTSNIETFKTDVVAGTRGSGIETGIYYAEQALLSNALGDDMDGTITTAGHPRADASMSVIILSDERSQYRSRSSTDFDVDNNLFVDRDYRVYSIVNERDANRSQYDDLAFSTGGAAASISDTETFPAIMEQIATNAGGASSRYVLSGNPVSSTIIVSVSGNKIIRSKNDGWQYISLSNSIVFYGEAIPAEGAEIVIEYSSIHENSDAENLEDQPTPSSGTIEFTGEMPALAKTSGCGACHDIDRKVVGPSFTDIALRYAVEDASTRETLITKVKKGGTGNWTEVTGGVPMPPYSPRVSDENIAAIVDFILVLDN